MPSGPNAFVWLTNLAVLLVLGALASVWYFRLCRKCWREFKYGVADAGGWNSRRPIESLQPRICPMCGAVVKRPTRQCLGCGERLPIDVLFTQVPTGVLLTCIVVAVLIPLLVVAGVSLIIYLAT